MTTNFCAHLSSTNRPNKLFLFSIGFCGYSQSSDSAISTSHSQSELSSSRQEYRLSFIYLKTMATLNETLACEPHDQLEDEAFDAYEESLNLSEYSSGQSTFDSGKILQKQELSK